eukprot:1154524-Pelagomonas_calceolata.AAC.6
MLASLVTYQLNGCADAIVKDQANQANDSMADTGIPGAGPGGYPFSHLFVPAPNHIITNLPNLQSALKSHVHTKHKLGCANLNRASIKLSHRNVMELWSSARRATARRWSPGRILVAGVEIKMPSIGGSQREALSLIMHAAERQAQIFANLKTGYYPYYQGLLHHWPGVFPPHLFCNEAGHMHVSLQLSCPRRQASSWAPGLVSSQLVVSRFDWRSCFYCNLSQFKPRSSLALPPEACQVLESPLVRPKQACLIAQAFMHAARLMLDAYANLQPLISTACHYFTCNREKDGNLQKCSTGMYVARCHYGAINE